MQLVEVKLPDVVDRLAGNSEAQSRRAESRAVAVGTHVLHHHLVEPRLHPGASLSTLAVASIMTLDTSRDAVKADLAADAIVARHLRFGRRVYHNLPLDPVENDVAGRLRQFLPRRVQRKAERLRQAEHHRPVPRVGIVLEGFAHEAAAADASPR